MITIARILCPTDFSDGSRHALDHAMSIARWYRSQVTVLHVHRLTTPVYAVAPVTMPVGAQVLTLTAAETAHLLDALEEFVAPERGQGTAVETALEQDFDVADAVLARAGTMRADLIVLGTHGRSGFQRFMLGSVAEKLLRRADCPVLTVPPRAGDVERPISMRPRILCAVDFSKASARALDYAASLARESDGALTALHVVDVPPESSDPSLPDISAYRTARFEEARLALAGTVAALDEGWKAAPLVLAGKPSREILRVAAEQQDDLIVMGVLGRGALDRAFFGSTAEHVVRQASCPVLTLRAPD
ncbi:MAG: universal stress protein [Acidimicrobiia bacterium]|nr:universal stress protein [Acidimicrobiia bacterium]